MTLQVEFAATLVDEWIRAGVRHAVVAPGSRSGPLALALLGNAEMAVHMRLDERSATFFALGIALASGEPVVMVTTSGTASGEVHAAVMEADLARVPLIVCTADRPPELHDVGAPQTVAQAGLFAQAVRFATDSGVPDQATRPFWRSFASRLVAEATVGPRGPGPVHANVAFREPFIANVGELPAGRAGGAPWHRVARGASASQETIEVFVDALNKSTRGCFVVGGNLLSEPDPILDVAARLRWPVLGDGRAIRRELSDVLISHADQFLRVPSAQSLLRPDLVVHVGSPHASKTLAQWGDVLGTTGVRHLLIDPFASYEDPERRADLVLGADAAALCGAAAARIRAEEIVSRDDAWLSEWKTADRAAAAVLGEVLDANGPVSPDGGAPSALTEPGVARRIVGQLPPYATLVCSSSMPVRDVEWFVSPREGAPFVLANRGANGIDGVISTVLGVAAARSGSATAASSVPSSSLPSRSLPSSSLPASSLPAAPSPTGPVVGLVGDLAFFHDLSALVWGRHEQTPDVTLVVIDNDGGGIFSFLNYPDVLERETFERGFGTPQGQSVAAVAAGLGCDVAEASSGEEFDAALSRSLGQSGISVLVVRTDRADNVAFHQRLTAHVAAAVDVALSHQTAAPQPPTNA